MIKKENTCNIINISKILESNNNQKIKIRKGANIEKSLTDTKTNKEFKRKNSFINAVIAPIKEEEETKLSSPTKKPTNLFTKKM